MKVRQFVNTNGNVVKNQFVITTAGKEVFQSHDTVIAIVQRDCKTRLDVNSWNYSRTTSKYRNQFLHETTQETAAKIASGAYLLEDLNT